MPEGHTIHRAARDQQPLFAGRQLAVSSPQGRFLEGAEHLDGQVCQNVEALGKHLLYGFESGDTLHIHLGLYGKIRKQTQPMAEPRGAVRVRLEAVEYGVDINGPNTCKILDPEGRAALFSRIGPDVLRSDADPDRAYARIVKSRSPVGVLIMNQEIMAGIGNIYRTEILWRQGIHPDLPGTALTRDAFDAIWSDSCALLEIGVQKNAIITVDGGTRSGKRYGEKVNIFNLETCPKCEGPVRKFEMATRRAFVCDTCQKLNKKGSRSTGKAAV